MNNLNLKPKIKSKKNLLHKVIETIVLLGIIIGLSFIANKFMLKPYRYKKLADETKNLYYNEEPDSIEDNADQIPDHNDFIKDDTDANEIQESKDRDEEGRLTQFKDLLEINEDVKGWISIPGSNIDYPIAQSDENNPEFYLYRNLYKEDDKAGTIFLDIKSSVEDNTKNLVLHGHNMASTNNMFHHLIKYNDLSHYMKGPVITFDTIYEKGDWKIFSLFKTNGSPDIEPVFDYTVSDFTNTSDYLNFIYQLKIRSIFDYGIDINEDDQILTLSTCSYEVNDYRTVIVARKVREDENPSVDLTAVKENESPLYPSSWYKTYGGSPPAYSSFEQALINGEINWYKQ